MVFLFLSILCSTIIFLLFKIFPSKNVNTFSAIVINYFTASICGYLLFTDTLEWSHLSKAGWLPNAIFLGLTFIFLFNMMALTAQRLGASVSSIANKMALVVPVIFAITYYGDEISTIKVIGICLSLAGIYLAILKKGNQKDRIDYSKIWLPIVVFIGSGFVDTFLKYNQEFHLKDDSNASKLFSGITFGVAFTIGLLMMLFSKEKRRLNLNTIIAGLVLGVVNFGSIYFLIEIFNHTSLESSLVFPINNVAVVILTTIGSILFFSERFSLINKIGIALCVGSILLISYA